MKRHRCRSVCSTRCLLCGAHCSAPSSTSSWEITGCHLHLPAEHLQQKAWCSELLLASELTFTHQRLYSRLKQLGLTQKEAKTIGSGSIQIFSFTSQEDSSEAAFKTRFIWSDHRRASEQPRSYSGHFIFISICCTQSVILQKKRKTRCALISVSPHQCTDSTPAPLRCLIKSHLPVRWSCWVKLQPLRAFQSLFQRFQLSWTVGLPCFIASTKKPDRSPQKKKKRKKDPNKDPQASLFKSSQSPCLSVRLFLCRRKEKLRGK